MAAYTLRRGVVSDAAAVLDIYRQEKMIMLDDDIEAGTDAEVEFWKFWEGKWAWRLEQESQIFIVAVVENEVVAVGRGGVNINEKGDNVSLLEIREKEASVSFELGKTTADDIPAYTGKDDEELSLGPVCRTFDAEINGMFVRPAFQRQGIGKALYWAMLEAMPDKDVTVWTWIGNTGALQFYLAQGCLPVGCRKRSSAIVRFACVHSS